jgi:uncharacterized membrane protein (UPF0127 family)
MIISVKHVVIILIIVAGCIATLAAAQLLRPQLSTWKTVNTSIGILYLADSPRLMAEGYKNKDSYDFANRGAVGMLFPIYMLKPTHVCFTMKDVKLPLVLLIAQRAGASRDFVVHYKVFMQPNTSDFCLSDMHFTFTYDVIAVELSPDAARSVARGSIITVYSSLP